MYLLKLEYIYKTIPNSVIKWILQMSIDDKSSKLIVRNENRNIYVSW